MEASAMTDLKAVVPADDLAALATTIKTKHRAVVDGIKGTVRAAMDAGDALAKAKAAVAHGEFAAWLRDNSDVMPRTAQDYMRLAAHRKQIETAMRDQSEGLSIAGALRMIRQSPDVKPEPKIVEDAVVSAIIQKVQTVLGKDHKRGLIVAQRVMERLADMRLVD
jgi:hypothetical protein